MCPSPCKYTDHAGQSAATVVGETSHGCASHGCDAAAQSPSAASAMQCSGVPEEATKPAQAAGAAPGSAAMCTKLKQVDASVQGAPAVAKPGIPEELTSGKLSSMLAKYKSENEALHETLQVLLEENQELASENACSREPKSPGWFNSFRFRGIA